MEYNNMNRPINFPFETNGKLECTKHTEGLAQVDTVTWTISNITKLLISNKGQLLVSCSNTEVGGKEHLKYKLKIRSNPWDQYPEIKVYFQSHQKVMTPTVTMNKYTYYPNAHNYDQEHSKAALVPMENTVEPYKWHFLISETYTNSRLPLVLRFEFRTYSKVDMNKIPGIFSWVDFGKLLGNEMLSDTVIKSTEGEEYKAHKVILAYRSSVLKTKFETKLNGNTTGSKSLVVEAPYSSKVVQEVLKFIYTNQADVNITTYDYELLDAAEHYHIDGLKELCEIPLCEKLNVKNAVQSLELALRYGLKILEIAVLQFSKENWDSLIKTEAWTNLHSVELVKRFTECHSLDYL